MSTEQSLDPQLIEQTKQQIRALVNEIAQLAKSGLTQTEFYGEFLTRVVSALAAVGGAIWTTNEEGRLGLQYQVNLREARLPDKDKPDDQERHARLLYRVLRKGEGGLMPPQSGSPDDEEAGNPTDFLLVLGPLKTEQETLGVVEVFQRPDTGLSTQKGYLRFLLQMCELAGDFLKTHQLRHLSDRQALWTQLEDFTQRIHSSLEPRKTAYTIANEARRLIDCDRVTIALRRGRRCRVEAISGQDQFEKRSNSVRLLAKLATEVVAAGDPVWFAGDTRDMAPQIENAVQEYVDESHTKALAVLPLKIVTPELEKEEDKVKRKEEEQEPFGALIVEQIEDARFEETTIQRVNVVCRHATTAMGNAMEHQSIFLMPIWRAIGKSRWVVRGRNLPIAASIAAGIVVAIVAMCIWPANFNLQSKGTLEPQARRDVFAKIDGVVDELLVHDGDKVQKGQLLAKLRNTELEVAMTEVIGQLTSTEQEMFAIQRTLQQATSGGTKLSSEEETRMWGKYMELKKNRESLQAKHSLYRQKQEDLKVVAPIAGTVITWDIYQRLIHRPVQRGQVLMRVGDLDGEWQLEMHMGEDRMGFITQAQQDIQFNLPISYILASEPGSARTAAVREVQYAAEVHGEEGSTVLIKADIHKEELPALRPGTTVTAKVYCGRRPVGYVWFHDLVAFIESRVIFRWF